MDTGSETGRSGYVASALLVVGSLAVASIAIKLIPVMVLIGMVWVVRRMMKEDRRIDNERMTERPRGLTADDDRWLAREWALTQQGRPAPRPAPRPVQPAPRPVRVALHPDPLNSPQARVARMYGGEGDSYSAYRAAHDHPWMCLIANAFDGWGRR